MATIVLYVKFSKKIVLTFWKKIEKVLEKKGSFSNAGNLKNVIICLEFEHF